MPENARSYTAPGVPEDLVNNVCVYRHTRQSRQRSIQEMPIPLLNQWQCGIVVPFTLLGQVKV